MARFGRGQSFTPTSYKGYNPVDEVLLDSTLETLTPVDTQAALAELVGTQAEALAAGAIGD